MIPPIELSVLLPCGHYLPQAELLRLAASINGKRSAGISRGARPGAGRAPKLAACPGCGGEFGVVAMREHRKECPAKPTPQDQSALAEWRDKTWNQLNPNQSASVAPLICRPNEGPRIGGTAHLPPERRSEIARLAGLARNTPERRYLGKRGPQPCHDPAIPDECTRCRRRAAEKRSRAKKA